MAGRTHGVPDFGHAPGFELEPPGEDDWVAVRIPSAVLLELVRTPTYSTWQGEQWLFCCGDAMTYLGEPEPGSHAFACRACGERRRHADLD
ncbi:CbrC family protein [Nonomuraea aridisoli]|nr:CbrC family protein [Nonomuraea aridisoli]